MIATSLFENGRYLALLILSIVVVGVTAYNSLGRQEDPTITPFEASVQTFYPGASPARIESLITKPIEDALREHPDVKELNSTSINGVSTVIIEVEFSSLTSGCSRSASSIGLVIKLSIRAGLAPG